MAEADNKALVRRLLEELRAGWRPATVERYFASTYRRHLTATSTPLTRDEQRERASRLRAAFPDAQATLEDIVAEGDAVSFIALVRIADGKLVEESGGLDQPDLIRQMRGLPAAP